MKKEIRPRKVSIAVTLLWITIALSILITIIRIPISLEMLDLYGLGSKFIIFTSIFFLIINAFFIFMIGRGKNWARITFLIIFILGIPGLIPLLIRSLTIHLFSGILEIGQNFLEIIALVLLFQRDSSAWFSSMKNT